VETSLPPDLAAPVSRYIGRFAPSPTGLLHEGSLVAALASWLDARAHGGLWRVRIEDVDIPRCPPGAGEAILRQLACCGLHPDGEVWWQSQRGAAYAQALDRLVQQGQAYPCGCSRKDIDQALAAQGHEHQRHAERVYPGTCRNGLHGKPARAWRVRTLGPQGKDLLIDWTDRRRGPQHQNLTQAVGDFILRRADALWAYQLAVVVDDAAQGITHVVRGEDLLDNTPRQIHLQHLLECATPVYLHTPLVMAADGQKLSKQNGAQPLDLSTPCAALRHAAQTLGLPLQHLPADMPVSDTLAALVTAWPDRDTTLL
jgi:glutamyl-Q tRNA(Asp) synthetase